jgi:hypothetical protein
MKKELSMRMCLSVTALCGAINEMPMPFYIVTINPRNYSVFNASEVVKEFGKDKEFIRTELRTNADYGADEWSIALCLKDNGKVTVLQEVWSKPY